jgi:hypothetical protein
MILQIFSAWASDKAPPNTVKSWLKNEHQTAIDHAVAGDDAIARNFVVLHPKVSAAVLNKHIPFFKGAFVQQQLDALARRELAFAVLCVDALLAPAQAGQGTLFLQLFQDALHSSSSLNWLIGYFAID